MKNNRQFIKAQRPFIHKGRKVIGMYALNTKQFIKTYLPIWMYAALLIYVVIRNAICDCARIYPGELFIVFLVTVATFTYTALILRYFERQNFVYEELNQQRNETNNSKP